MNGDEVRMMCGVPQVESEGIKEKDRSVTDEDGAAPLDF